MLSVERLIRNLLCVYSRLDGKSTRASNSPSDDKLLIPKTRCVPKPCREDIDNTSLVNL